MTGSREKPQAVTWILRVMAALLAMYGLYLFGRKDIFSYMFLKQQFVFFDFEQPSIPTSKNSVQKNEEKEGGSR